MAGLNKYDPKLKRKIRLQNHIARDLRTPKYAQRKREVRKESDEHDHWTSRDWINHLDDEDLDID